MCRPSRIDVATPGAAKRSRDGVDGVGGVRVSFVLRTSCPLSSVRERRMDGKGGFARYVRLKDGFSQTGRFPALLFPRIRFLFTTGALAASGRMAPTNVAQEDPFPCAAKCFFADAPRLSPRTKSPATFAAAAKPPLREALRAQP